MAKKPTPPREPAGIPLGIRLSRVLDNFQTIYKHFEDRWLVGIVGASFIFAQMSELLFPAFAPGFRFVLFLVEIASAFVLLIKVLKFIREKYFVEKPDYEC